MEKNKKEVKNNSTEEKIKASARKMFHQKGFAGTRTRDIAEESGINLALLNYYFRSKEKLFQLIMSESLDEFFSSLHSVFNDPVTNFNEKIEAVVKNYVEKMTENPNIPLFILSELRNNPDQLIKKVNAKKVFLQSVFLSQLDDEIKANRINAIDPMHFIMNLLGMTVFPFVASPMMKSIGDIDQENFDTLMDERKKLIPMWIKAILKS
jgi:AcrR family transcriptional regulator